VSSIQFSLVVSCCPTACTGGLASGRHRHGEVDVSDGCIEQGKARESATEAEIADGAADWWSARGWTLHMLHETLVSEREEKQPRPALHRHQKYCIHSSIPRRPTNHRQQDADSRATRCSRPLFSLFRDLDVSWLFRDCATPEAHRERWPSIVSIV
jgi:hypothetical protein